MGIKFTDCFINQPMRTTNLTLSSPEESVIQIELPVSKSIGNRLLMIAALKGNLQEFLLANPVIEQNGCRDTALLIHALKQHESCKNTLLTPGLKQQEFDSEYQTETADQGIVNYKFMDAGTPCRLFTAFAAAKFMGVCDITGNKSLNARSIAVLVDSLRDMGAQIEYLAHEGYTPIRIRKGINGWKHNEINANISSQYVSALMLIAPIFPGIKTLQVANNAHSLSYIELTASALNQANVSCSLEVNDRGPMIVIDGEYTNFIASAISKSLESDWSSAAFFYPLLRAMPNQPSILLSSLNLDSIQGDAAMPDFGAVLGITSRQTQLGVIIEKTNISQQIPVLKLHNQPDLVPAIVVALAINQQSAILEGIENLKFKESNRIVALQSNLEKLCCTLTQSTAEDNLWNDIAEASVNQSKLESPLNQSKLESPLNQSKLESPLNQSKLESPPNEQSTEVHFANHTHSTDSWYLNCSSIKFPTSMIVETHSDHRIAMAFSALHNIIPELTYTDRECVEKSFPNFWEQWKKCTFE